MSLGTETNMQALQEIVDNFPGHVYLVEGNRILAYQTNGRGPAEYFAHSMRFDRRSRKFVPASIEAFEQTLNTQSSSMVEVKGSSGVSYWIDQKNKSCTCPGFQFRGNCKHLTQWQTA